MFNPTRSRAALSAAIGAAIVASVVIAAAATANATAGVKTVSTSSTTTTTTTTTSTTTTTTTTTTTLPTLDPAVVYADIYVALDIPVSDGPMEFQVTEVEVGPGPEMSGVAPFANPSGFCGDAYVDIDPVGHGINFGGGGGACDFTTAYVEVTLYGDTFTSVTLTSDSLFSEEPFLTAPARGSGPGGLGYLRAATPPLPALVTYGVAGATFSASWVGTVSSVMDGTASFRVAFGSDPATGVRAGANFTG